MHLCTSTWSAFTAAIIFALRQDATGSVVGKAAVLLHILTLSCLLLLWFWQYSICLLHL